MPPGTWPKVHGRAFPSAGSVGYLHTADEDIERMSEESVPQVPRRRKGYLARLIDLYNYYDSPDDNVFVSNKREAATRAANQRGRLVDPLAYDDDQLLDQDDPLVTGIKKRCLDNMDDVEHDTHHKLSYRERREEQQRVRIQRNVCSEYMMRSLSRVAADASNYSRRYTSEIPDDIFEGFTLLWGSISSYGVSTPRSSSHPGG